MKKTLIKHLTVPLLILALVIALEALASTRNPAAGIRLFAFASPPRVNFRLTPPELRP